MKHPIKWYENNLVNSMKYHQDLLRQIESLEVQANKVKDSNDFLRLQILKAKEKNKDSFDSERFLTQR